MTMSVDTHADLSSWIGRTEECSDTVTAAPLGALFALLDRTDVPLPGMTLPALAHWLYCLPQPLQRDIDLDGDPKRGGFLPPVALPRRMWAGGRLRWDREVQLGDELRRRSTIAKIDVKHGRSGALVFVTVDHAVVGPRGIVLNEQHDIVYRDAPAAGAPPAVAVQAPTDEHFSATIEPDAALLFRYSALTSNMHRIHRDRSYAVEVERFPGIVVHGPLIATYLVDLVRRHVPGARIRAFSFKAVSPLFDIHPFTVCGRREGSEADGRVALWARNHLGELAMTAEATLASTPTPSTP